jgi:hypothetical protein
MNKQSSDILSTAWEMLAEVNQALDERFMGLPEDVRTLLVQKGALTQTLIRELTYLIELAADKAQKHDALLDKISSWQEDFFLPLKDQSDGKPVVKEIYLRDLESMIEELNKALAERDG